MGKEISVANKSENETTERTAEQSHFKAQGIVQPKSIRPKRAQDDAPTID